MGKRSAASQPPKGVEALATEGITASSLDAGEIPAERLAAILATGNETSRALTYLLGEVPRTEHAAVLAAAEVTAHGTLRREVRRALYRLRQAGIEPPPPVPAPEEEHRAAASEDAPASGWLSHVDGRGDRLVWITKPIPHGVLFIYARLNDLEGVLDLAAHELSRRQFRAHRDALRDRHGLRMVEVDWRHVDALLVAAPDRRSSSTAPPYTTRRVRLTTDPPAAVEAPIYAHVPRDAVDPSLVAVSGELLDAEELRTWLPDPADVKPYATEILDVKASPLVLSQHQQGERVTSVLERAVRDLYSPAIFAPRLEAMAHYFWKTGRERPARIALAAAHALHGGTPSHAVPVLAELLRQGLAGVYEVLRATAEDEEERSIIVKPGMPTARDPLAATGRRRP